MFRTHHPLAFLALAALLAACGGSNNSGGGGGGPDGGGNGGGNTTITGRVVDSGGQPVPGRTVVQSGRSTTTDTNGSFTFTTVAVPYDIAIVQTSGNKYAVVYTQLTRTDPTLSDVYLTLNNTRSTTVSGTLTVPSSVPADTVTGVVFSSPEASVGNNFATNTFNLVVSWFGPTATTGSVHALQWTTDANGMVAGVSAHGVRTGVTLQNGTPAANADVTLTSISTQTVTGSIAAPSGFTIDGRGVFVSFADGAAFPVGQDQLSTPGFGFPLPTGIGASAVVVASASDGALASSLAQTPELAPGTSNVTLTLPAPAAPTAPASGATGVDTSTTLGWSAVAGGGVYRAILSGTGTDPIYLIVSGTTTARIPDLSAQGLGLPSGRPYSWFVSAFGPLAGIDAFAGPTFPGLLYRTDSGDSTFTTR